MIYGHIPQWMADENPSFAAAVACYYSLEHGKLNDAAIGEVAWRKMAEELLDRAPFQGDAHLLSRVAAEEAKDRAALRRSDLNYFRRLFRACGAYRHKPVEYIFEAYLYLRRRAGEGSPLPNEKEVKQIAALIWAFKDVGIMTKLSKYLWHNTGLSQKEEKTVLFRQEQHLARKDREDWPFWLKQAGLDGLK
jgi:hypothetical protein